MKSDIVAGLNYQDKKDKRISEWVKYSRKMALAPVHKFAKDHHISGTLVKKYESGEYDRKDHQYGDEKDGSGNQIGNNIHSSAEKLMQRIGRFVEKRAFFSRFHQGDPADDRDDQ